MTREDMQHLFQVDDRELALLNKFQDEHKKCSCGFAGDKFSYSFCPTSIGTVITVTCSCGKSLRLGCFLESDDKEKQDLSVYTFRKAQDDNTNKIVKAILNMKNARIRRLYCHGEVRYEYLMIRSPKVGKSRLLAT